MSEGQVRYEVHSIDEEVATPPRHKQPSINPPSPLHRQIRAERRGRQINEDVRLSTSPF